jgi:phosphate transport system substrate-binding protein
VAVVAVVAVVAEASHFIFRPTSPTVPAQPQAIAAAMEKGAPAPSPTPQAEEKVLLRLQGSNTIGATLAPRLAEAYLNLLGDRNVIVEHGAQSTDTKVYASNGGHRDVITISAHGSSTAFEGLRREAADIGMASRRIKADEVQLLSSYGDMTAGYSGMTGPASEHVLGLDGIAVVVNRANKVSELSKNTVAAIFAGIIKNWSQLGGEPGEITVYARDNKSGTYDTFDALVLAGGKLTPTAKRFEDSAELTAAVAADPNGIGFIGLPFIGPTKALAISDAGAAPLLPTRFTVATEDYPVARRLYLYTPQPSPNRNVGRFIEFALSREGQAIVEQAGFVALTIKSEKIAVPQGASAQYQKLTKGALRLSSSFRFAAGSATLDNRALKEFDRVVDFMATVDLPPDHLMLFGFSDNQDQPEVSLALSKQRVQAVADLLARHGLPVGTSMAVGAELPVADNSTAEGREKNRRVEVFVHP